MSRTVNRTIRSRLLATFISGISVTALLAVFLAPGCQNTSGPPAGRNSFPTTAGTSQPTTALRIIVKDVRNRKGSLIFGVFTSSDGFPSDEKKSVAWSVRKADADSYVFTASLPPGVYGASVLHDENDNGKMDTGFGIPKEGYGVTNNPKPRFRAARFSESTFELPPDGKELTISLQYF